ncbi:unnamed protein product [Peronospora destructor]|uniref:Uncharacterized protein n=1 Tax=Peronospora destructor TaxID=86335 RepID=A0AAV0V9E4_9STRA|nr:unnamed protein product [Peronospora destructor]
MQHVLGPHRLVPAKLGFSSVEIWMVLLSEAAQDIVSPGCAYVSTTIKEEAKELNSKDNVEHKGEEEGKGYFDDDQKEKLQSIRAISWRNARPSRHYDVYCLSALLL